MTMELNTVKEMISKSMNTNISMCGLGGGVYLTKGFRGVPQFEIKFYV